jgi:hypothetical protein
MIGPEFASCFLKLGRAEEHFNTIKAELIEWKERNPYIVSKQCDAQGSRHSLIVEITYPPPLEHWSLIAGDCIHNLRATLDNLVYAIAVKESGTDLPPNFNILQFPITGTPKEYAGQQRRIATLSANTQARIERAQPYNRSHTELPPLLALLSEFDNVDKHRLLNVVVNNVSGGKFSIPLTGEMGIFVPPDIGYYSGPIKSGTEFAYFILTPPKRDVHYEYKATFVVSIAHSAGPSGRTFGELAYLLEIIITEVRRIVESFIF